MLSRDAFIGIVGVVLAGAAFVGAYGAASGDGGDIEWATFEQSMSSRLWVKWSFDDGAGALALVDVDDTAPVYTIDIDADLSFRPLSGGLAYMVFAVDGGTIYPLDVLKPDEYGEKMTWTTDRDISGWDGLVITLERGRVTEWRGPPLFVFTGMRTASAGEWDSVDAQALGTGEVDIEALGEGFTVQGTASGRDTWGFERCVWVVGPDEHILVAREAALPQVATTPLPREVAWFSMKFDLEIQAERASFGSIEWYAADTCDAAAGPAGHFLLAYRLPWAHAAEGAA